MGHEFKALFGNFFAAIASQDLVAIANLPCKRDLGKSMKAILQLQHLILRVAIAQWIRLRLTSAVLGLNPKHNIYAFSNYI